MDSDVDNWNALKAVLEAHVGATSLSRGETITVIPDPESDLQVVLIAEKRHMNIAYIPERNAVRWETAAEYGFERLEEPVSSLAALLVKWLFER